MAGSQLKRLKATLREQGIVGPQQSKKQKRKTAQDERGRNEKRLHRGAVLEGIREQFNPFDLKHAARGPKFEVTSNRPVTASAAKGIKGNPGLAKAASEERRRETLLVDMQRRNKVGGILDRRFGENDPTMTPEERMVERFAMEKQRSHKRSSMFDLEDDEPMDGLTHMGKSLSFEDEELVDDFQEVDLDEHNDSDGSEREMQRRKRLRAMAQGDDEAEDEQPERKKTKKEVMEEVIAKSKMHKYERQVAKEEDDDLRTALDKQLPNIKMLLATSRNGQKHQQVENGLISTIAGVDKGDFDRNFDLQVKRLAQDRRAKPADRTKTDEEKAEQESQRLQEMENKRQRRMRGEDVTDSEDDDAGLGENGRGDDDEIDEQSDDDFGLGSGIKTRPTATDLGFDDEDDFIIDDDLVASGSDLDIADSDQESDDDSGDEFEHEDEDDEDEFTKGLLSEIESKKPEFAPGSSSTPFGVDNEDHEGLPYTFPCPVSCTELQSITASYPATSLPTIIQRIRALHHPKMDSKNKERLARFSTALVDFICSPWDPATSPPFAVLESIIRHIHSLAKMFPVEISTQFRYHIEEMGRLRPLALEPSDLILLTAVGIVFPTSDHFHQVVTPAMLSIGRYLGQKVPQKLSDLAVGSFLSILALQYQELSKRYVPEVINFTLNALCALSPVPPPAQLGNFPLHDPPADSRIAAAADTTLRQLTFSDCLASTVEGEDTMSCKVAILFTAIQICDAAADTWTGKESFPETFDQVGRVLSHLDGRSCRSHIPQAALNMLEKLRAKLQRMIGLSNLSRRPLELHHHRPLAIKTFIPKFEETFDPDKHYDPDRERAELAKLKAEHKRERKGAMRELRKDANFMAREKLKVKKAKDEAYEKKYKRLVAEIQSEEGREANAYEREKKARKRAKHR